MCVEGGGGCSLRRSGFKAHFPNGLKKQEKKVEARETKAEGGSDWAADAMIETDPRRDGMTQISKSPGTVSLGA